MDTMLNILFAFLAGGVCSLPLIIPTIWLHREIKKSETKKAEERRRARGQIIDVEAVDITSSYLAK